LTRTTDGADGRVREGRIDIGAQEPADEDRDQDRYWDVSRRLAV
jgi:hypothetical protein